MSAWSTHPLAQLALRTDSDEVFIVLEQGASFDVDGIGTLHLDAVHAREGTVRGEVTLRLEEAVV